MNKAKQKALCRSRCEHSVKGSLSRNSMRRARRLRKGIKIICIEHTQASALCLTSRMLSILSLLKLLVEK